MKREEPATTKKFQFHAPRDGTYWLLVGTVDKQGRGEPENLNRVKPTLRVCVDTKRPSTQLAVKGSLHKASSVVDFDIWCKVTDANLVEDTIVLEWSEQPDGPWTSLETSKINPNKDWECSLSMRWTKNLPEHIYVRLRAKDRAGNETLDTQSIEIKTLPEPDPRLKPTRG